MFDNNFTITKKLYDLQLKAGIKQVTKYIITASWSIPAIFVANNKQEANDFIKGFNKDSIINISKAYKEGLDYKECLEMNI